MTEPQIIWAIRQPARRAFWPYRKCSITGLRIGFGELFNKAQQIKVLPSSGWVLRDETDDQYISAQGHAILMLQGNEPIEEVKRVVSRIGPGK